MIKFFKKYYKNMNIDSQCPIEKNKDN